MANKTIGKDVAQPAKFAAIRAELTEAIPLAQDEPPKLLNVPDDVLSDDIAVADNQEDNKYVIPLDGRWKLSSDPTRIGKNFSTLLNMRPIEDGIESVRGMTRINTTALNGTSFPRSAYHFRKSQPSETHILVQAYGTTGTCSTVFFSDFAIPFTGTNATAGTSGVFSSALWTDSTAGTGGTQRRAQWSDAPNGQVSYCNGIDTCLWGGNEMPVGAFIQNGTVGNGGMGGTASTFAFDYTNRMVNSNTDAENLVTLSLGTDGTCNLQIGSVRPLQGIKLYVNSANTSAGTASGLYWDGQTEQLMTIADNTASGGATLAQTGTITFASTVDTAKLRYLEGRLLYFYHFRFGNLVTTTKLSQCTTNAPFQNLYDLWDGTYRQIASFYRYFSGTYTDYTLNVREDFYVESDADSSSYVTLSDLFAYNDWIEVGFTEKQTGLFFALPAGHVNTTVGVARIISYWDGKQYTEVTAYGEDGTDTPATTATSFGQPGVMSWWNSNLAGEVKRSINNGMPLYYYKVHFSGTFSSDVRLYYVAGISATKKITGYSFAVHTNDRLMLGCNNYEKKNSLLVSAKNAPDVFNGIDAFEIEFGDDRALTCGIPIYAQNSANIFNFCLVFKAAETWLLSWIEEATGTIWERFRISPYIGCPAPLTLKTASVAFDKNTSQTKLIGVWRGNNGIYISDSHTPLEVSGDIRDVFDQTKPVHVNLAMIAYETGFMDHQLNEYHWLWASNSNTDLDKHYVLSFREWRWFEIDPGTGNRLQLGISVTDTDGNHYAYGFTDNGFMHRLEFGLTFNGSDGTSAVQFGDQLPVPQDPLAVTSISRVNTIAVAKGTNSTITLRHMIDGGTAGTYTLSDADPTRRYANQVKDIYSTSGVFHGFRLDKVWNGESKPWEPLYVSAYYKKQRDKLK